MKTLTTLFAICLLAAAAQAQNWTTVSASNITDLNQNKLAAGQLCFLGTDQNDNPISFNVGGGGQILKRAFCSAVTTGSVAAFTIPNPQNTTPAGVYYRVTVKDSSTGQEVLRYTQVTFTGGTFNFDSYAPTNIGSFNPPSGTATPGNLTVNGNLNVTGSFAFGSAVPITQGGTGVNTAAAAFNALSPMTTLGDLEYESGTNTAARLPGNTTSTKKYLSQTGTGSASAAPAWAQIASADLPSTAVQTNQANTYTSGTQDFSSASLLKAPTNFQNSQGGNVSQLFIAGCTGTVAANQTLYLPIIADGVTTCTNIGSNLLKPILSSPGTVRNLFCRAVTGGVNSNSGVVAVNWQGHGPSTVTCTLGMGTTCSDTTHSFITAAGDQVYLQFTTQPGDTLSFLVCSFEKQ